MRVEYGAKISSFQEIAVLQKKDTAMELITNDHFFRFKQGDEGGLTYLYKFLHKSLLRHGLRIVSDEFVVNSSIQEAFLKLEFPGTADQRFTYLPIFEIKRYLEVLQLLSGT